MEFKVDHEIKLPDQIFDARYHPTCDNLVAVATISGSVHLFENDQLKSKLRKHHKGSAIRKIRFTRDGRMVTIAKTVKVHDIVSDQTTHTLKRDDGKSTTFYSVQPFGNNIITAGDDDGGIFVWDTRTPEEVIFSSYDCEQYISDIDGKYETRKLIACTSGEGTLTAYDMRAKKMIEPQSELFDAGFQCLKFVEDNKKVVIGAEDGSIYVFNQNEWAHTSGKFAISDDLQNRGCSDGKIRAVTLWPHQMISATSFCKHSALESVHVSPLEGQSKFVVSGERYINLVSYEEKNEPDSDDEMHVDTADTAASGKHEEKPPTSEGKFKPEIDDYLNVFN